MYPIEGVRWLGDHETPLLLAIQSPCRDELESLILQGNIREDNLPSGAKLIFLERQKAQKSESLLKVSNRS